MENLRVTAHMAEPVVYQGDGLHIDGILAFAHYSSLSREQREALPHIDAEPLDFPLPLSRWDAPGGAWGWCASAAHADWLSQDLVRVRRRPPAAEMARYTTSPSVNVKGGRYRMTDLPFPARFAREVWWFVVGDKREVTRLLGSIYAIGKLCAHGYGKVHRWEVIAWPHDWSCLRDSMPTRRLADGAFGLAGDRLGAIRPPYHHPSRVWPCVDPNYEELS